MGQRKAAEYVESLWNQGDDNLLRLFFAQKLYYMHQVEIEKNKLAHPGLYEEEHITYDTKKLEVCRDLFHNFDYATFLTGDDLEKARMISGGTGKKFTLPEVNERINELLKHSIQSEGVINLFSDVDTEFLEEISRMKEKNLAVELLKKLIAEQVSIYRRTNVVKSEKFSEIIQSAMNRYLNGMLTNEEVIEELLKKHKYPPEGMEDAVKTVMSQCEMWTDNQD